MKIKAEIEVTEEQLKDLLCCAFEGGSNYWIDYAKRHDPKVLVQSISLRYHLLLIIM